MSIDMFLIKEIVNPIIYIFVGLLLYGIIKKVLKRSYDHTSKLDIKKKKTVITLISNIAKYGIAIIVILMILEVYGVNTGAILASLGIVGLVVGLALQDLIKDFVAGAFIIFDNQYSIGDTVTIENFKGEVIALGLKTTKLKAANGDIYCIANGQITDVINHSQSDNMAIVDVDVAYEEDLDKVLEVLNTLVKRLDDEISDLTGPIEVLGVTNLGANGVTIRITVNTISGKQFDVERIIRKEVKNTFDKEKISIPYSQVVVYNGK